MKQLNRAAAEVYLRFYKSVHMLTDVTGFGLLGHLDSAMRASKTRARIDAAKVAVLPGVRELAREGVVPGGTQANLAFVSERATFPEKMTAPDRLVLADAQTNGGMLAAVDAKSAANVSAKPLLTGLVSLTTAPRRAWRSPKAVLARKGPWTASDATMRK